MLYIRQCQLEQEILQVRILSRLQKKQYMMKTIVKSNTLASVFKQTLIGTTALASIVLFMAAAVIAIYKAAGM